MDIQEMNYDMLKQIADLLLTIANNQVVLRDELQNINNSIQEISVSGVYNLQDICEKLDSIDTGVSSIDLSIT